MIPSTAAYFRLRRLQRQHWRVLWRGRDTVLRLGIAAVVIGVVVVAVYLIARNAMTP